MRNAVPGFPLEDLEKAVKEVIPTLEKAEGQCSKDKDLSSAIKDAKESAAELEKKLRE